MRFERSIVPAFIVGCGVLLAGAVGFTAAVKQLQYFLMKEPIDLRKGLDTIPTTLGKWQRSGTDARLSKEIVEELGTAQYLDRGYAIDGNPTKGRLQVHLAYYTGTIDDVPHIPERCSLVQGNQIVHGPLDIALELTKTGWVAHSGKFNRATGLEYPSAEVADPVTLRPSTVHLPIGDYVLRVTEFQNQKQPKRRMVAGYFFIANGRMTPSAYGVRALSFSRTERFAYYCKVQLSLEGEVGRDGDSLIPVFVSRVQDLLDSLLPPLMARLPDWPAVEAAPSLAAPQ
ncbi:MAG: exosortase-associated EpsI family protein [Phycisphaerae bacterium]|nr:exosortase-associated EpsI family protein [Phycisphaerae bacterium]